MSRLIWVFAGCIGHFGFVVLRFSYCRTCFSMGDLGVQVSVRLSIRLFVRSSVRQHLPWVSCERNSSYSFVPVFLKLGGVFIMVWGCACGLDIIVGLFFVTFSTLWTYHFSTSVYRQWVPCERNSSYNFIPIFLKLCTYFLHGLKMCMWFGYTPWLKFCHFFHFANFVIFWHQILWKCCDSGYLVSPTPHTILCRSFWNFAHIFHMVWRSAYGLDIILEFIFVTFSTLWTLSFSDLRFYESVETVGTLWAQLLIQFYTDLYETLYMFLPWSGDVHVVWI